MRKIGVPMSWMHNVVTFLSVLLFGGGIVFGQSSTDKLDVYIGTSMNVGADVDLYLEGNMYCDDVPVNSDGSVTVYSDELSEVHLPDEISGNGLLTFMGNGDFDVTSVADFSVSNFTINTDGVVSIANNFSVSNQLTLSNGIVEMASPNVLFVESNDENSLVFDNSDYSCYVIGSLGRNIVSASNAYYFPIGGSDGAYPLFIEDIDNDDVLIALYDNNIGSNVDLAISEENYAMLSESGWYISSENYTENNFIVGLWAPEQFDISGTAGILHSESSDYFEYTKVANCDNPVQSYLATTEKVDIGYFVLIQDDELSFRNFYLINSSNANIFEIPNASSYSNIELTLYNRVGAKVFYSSSYNNQLNLSDYPTGVYYYELVLEEDESDTQTIYNFIEVKNENY